MPERHADQLFSSAYDGELDHGGRRRFDAHVEGCARCADAWEDYRAALDAVRALPAVAMPATVRLPVGAPQPERRRAAFLSGLRAAVLHPQPVWAASGLAAVALALVVLAVHHPGGGTSGTSSSVRGGVVAQAPAYGAPALPNGLSQAPPLLAPMPCPVSPVAVSAQPASFTHTATAPEGSGQQLVLATQQESYAPGQAVAIYARLTSASTAHSANDSDVVPCVTLESQPSSDHAPVPQAAPAAPNRAAAPAPGQAEAGTGSSAAGQAPANSEPVPPTPLAVATSEPGSFSAAGAENAPAPAGGSSKQVSSGPLLTVTIPSNIPRGTVLQLVAVIPPGYPGNSTSSPIQVVLYITVR